MLRKHLETYTPNDPGSLVFTADGGSVVRNSNFRRKVWKPALRAAGVAEKTRLHDLRHTCASILISNGESIKVVRKQLGHSTAMLTLDVYASLMEGEQEAAVKRMDDAFSRKKKAQ
jgi:integrase